MGWNQGYSIVEATVVGAYDLGKLDKDLLSVLLEPYRNSDIDSGGSRELKSKDGKSFEQIVVEAWGQEQPPAPAGEYDDNPDAWDDYNDAVCEKFRQVTANFGW